MQPDKLRGVRALRNLLLNSRENQIAVRFNDQNGTPFRRFKQIWRKIGLSSWMQMQFWLFNVNAMARLRNDKRNKDWQDVLDRLARL